MSPKKIKNSKKETKVLGVRMPLDLKTKLEGIAKERNQSLNQLANIALEEWIQSLAYAKKIKFMIIHKDFFANLLKFLDEDKKNSLAIDMAHLTAEIFRDLMNIPLSRARFDEFNEILPSFLCDSGLKWFESLEIVKEGAVVILKGFHYLGLNFSKFFTSLSEELLKRYFDYDLIKKDLNFTPNSIFLEFKPKN
ncbi:MAG: hypothetical protein GF317_11330 [Candidatus Lokiarchaeota archaeon]|nr:hypothetical protein [Candidatus Lokiarchaeota archaeon]MBD3200241.1 hypothetical protein [Candidatus Lokiarchaeota archaeon]